jgi:glutathione S-transferase
MKLYYSPGACSLSPHIALHEAGIPFEAIKIDNKAKTTADGLNYMDVNSKGYVPALRLDDGSVLTEGPAIVQYIADKNPAARLAPAAGTIERYRLQEWLNFITSELHKNFGPLFNPAAGAEWKAGVTANLEKRFTWVDQQLAGKQYLMGDQFSVADGYLFTVLNWTTFIKMDLARWPNLIAYMGRVAARPKVQAAMKAEGLLQ